MASFARAVPFYRERNEDSPKRLSSRVTRTIFSKLRAAPGRFQKQSKLVNTHTPLQNPLHARKTAFNQLGRKERKPRQVNKKQW